MSKIIEKTIEEIFEPQNGNSKYTKTFCVNNEGEYIVYTGTTIGVFGKVNFADYREPNLTFTTDGENSGTLEYITDDGYCIGGHRTILKPIIENVDLEYFKYILQPLFFKNVKRGNVPSLHFSQVKKLKVSVPVLDDGNLDVEKQREMAIKYREVEEKKKILIDKISILNKTKIAIDNDTSVEYVNVPITKLFTPKGGDMKLSKPYCNENPGTYPVYSGSTSQEIFSNINDYKYDGEYLTWVIDGLAGYIMKLSDKFSITCHRGILLPTDECKNIHLGYVKYVLEPVFRSRIRGRIGIDGKNEYTALKPKHIVKYNDSIPIPIKSDGTYDYETQEKLAYKYATIESIKKELYDRVVDLTSIVVK